MVIQLRLPGSTANLGPGFDTLGLALKIYNRVTIRTTLGAGMKMVVQGEGAGLLSKNRTNLFFQAASKTAKLAGKSLPGLEVRMENKIPIAKGLGSSSTAIVGGILASNLLLGEPFSDPEMINLASKLEGHSDNICPCFLGGLTISFFSDGKVDYLQALPPLELCAVVAIPNFQIKTKEARAILPKTISHQHATFNVSKACLVTAALLSGNLQLLRTGTQDKLHQPYRRPLIPNFDQVREAALTAGALCAFLSGAGPAIVAFTTENAEVIKQDMVEAWRKGKIEAEAHVLRIDPKGARVL